MSPRREINQVNPAAVSINNHLGSPNLKSSRNYYLEPKALRTSTATFIAGRKTETSTTGKLKTSDLSGEEPQSTAEHGMYEEPNT